MGTVTNFFLCSFVVVMAQGEVKLQPDRPFLKVLHNGRAELECCYNATKLLDFTWYIRVQAENITLDPTIVNISELVTARTKKTKDGHCSILTFSSVQLNDTGLYLCWLNNSNINLFTYGTYLHVYKPLEKTLNLSENTKNKILTAEGILLFLCVLLPAATLICQSKKLSELEKKKVKREEENIYQGLNLDDCCETYEQIERALAHGPYQDVCNIKEEEEEIQLEKP
ncbi:B-cell antigen receptor complex-associated protein alpha chain [Chelmon rostratus]|uniref:B-cell antigen receptor complex-associated protein alpha chain n=1 Tax=Chelmon rostratus TaxID=109905 RepID=UPI001BE8C3C1|nr:B-cell antigen receptor complex-associated protein alpha chain [Chelmon rostratus]